MAKAIQCKKLKRQAGSGNGSSMHSCLVCAPPRAQFPFKTQRVTHTNPWSAKGNSLSLSWITHPTTELLVVNSHSMQVLKLMSAKSLPTKLPTHMRNQKSTKEQQNKENSTTTKSGHHMLYYSCKGISFNCKNKQNHHALSLSLPLARPIVWLR